MAVFIDASGKYYQAGTAKDSGDAKIEHPTKQMLDVLTEIPVTVPDFGRGVLEKEVAKLSIPEKAVEKDDEL